MRCLSRLFFVVLVAAVVIAPALASATSAEELQDVPISIALITAAELEARLTPVDEAIETWTPLFNSAAPTESDVTITETAAVVVRPEVAERFVAAWNAQHEAQASDEVLSGPQGSLRFQSGVTVRNPASPDFYANQTVFTAAMVKIEWQDPGPGSSAGLNFFGFSGDPGDDFLGVTEASLAFSYPGDALLADSPQFDYDPLVGYGNVANWGSFGGTSFSGYAKYIDGTWQQFQDPLVSFSFTSGNNDLYYGYLLPGVPDALAFNLSYSPEASLDNMVAQHAPIAQIDVESQIQIEAGDDVTYGDLDPSRVDFVYAFFQAFGSIPDEPNETEVTPPETVPDPPTTLSTSTMPTTPEESAAPVATTVGDSNAVLFLGLTIVIGSFILLAFGRSRRGRSGATDDLFDGDAGLRQPTADEEILRRHLLTYGGSDAVDGWIAPSYGALTALYSAESDRAAEDWSEEFRNVDTGETVRRGEDGFDELMEKLDQPRPPEWGDPIDENEGGDGNVVPL